MSGHDHLTRTHSSLLRSSPTVRSSFTTLISDDRDRSHRQRSRHHPGGGLVVVVVAATVLLVFLTFELPLSNPSEKLLFILVFVAVAMFYLGRNKNFIYIVRQIKKEMTGAGGNAPVQLPVEWFIGDDKPPPANREALLERVEFYTNGDYYEGEFNRGKSNGAGVYNYSVKGRYEGEWVEGKYDGFGIESWAKGSRYRGQYKCGMRHGVGVYRFYTGDTYAGEWFNGQYHGLGIQSCSDGSFFVGVFKIGVKHGLGCYHFRNGDRYAGEYFGDKIHGFGVYHFANGHCYEGSWHEGRKQGYGMYTFRNGEAKCGEWNCGSLKTPLPPLTESVLRAVQSARKAAENAISLRRVDEQVNNAVVGANRAATAARVAAVKAVQNRMDGKFYDTDA